MRTPIAIIAFAAGLSACTGLVLRRPVAGDALVVAGRVERGPYGLSADELAARARRTVRGVEPRSGIEAAFEGTDIAPMFTEGLARLPGTDTLVFYGAGGMRAAIPLNVVRQSRPVLASRADGKPVDERVAGAGALLVAWPDAEQPGLDTDPRLRWFWVRGVTRVDVVVWLDTYGRALRVPPGGSDEARRGADLFGSQCIHCHRIRRQGGDAGPELTLLLAEGDERRLRAALPGHLAARSGVTSAPEISPAAATELAAFLRAVALAGQDPVTEEPVKELPPYRPPPPAGRR
jgi:mono/diheme cytochrome c family protein